MSGTEFEDLVAALCRHDGCTDVRRVGGSGDNGADVTGRLPDGRTMIVQCKRYTTTSTIAGRETRDLLGAKAHFGADLAAFVTTTRFSRPSETFALQNGILAIHRDHLGLWNNGATLQIPDQHQRLRPGRPTAPSPLEEDIRHVAQTRSPSSRCVAA